MSNQTHDKPIFRYLTAPIITPWLAAFTRYRKRIVLVICMVIAGYGWFNPYQFAGWWLTKDQQGLLLFELEHYELASQRFTNTRWQAFSLYGAEQYTQSATLYSQFTTKEDYMARANALAHGQEYVKAKALYQVIIDNNPEYEAAIHNLAIVTSIIDQINLMSESQKSEQGDSSKELGDDPQRADGEEKQEARQQKIEQLSAEQLLLDPSLNEMWLRQVQKNPGRFLSIKFQMQLEQSRKVATDEQQKKMLGILKND